MQKTRSLTDILRSANNPANSSRADYWTTTNRFIWQKMPSECVREYRGESRWRSMRDGLYIALFSFHLRGVPPSAAFVCVVCSPAYACACANVCLLISSVLTSTYLLNPRSARPPPTPPHSIAYYDEIHPCHCACGRSCVPSENNNRGRSTSGAESIDNFIG